MKKILLGSVFVVLALAGCSSEASEAELKDVQEELAMVKKENASLLQSFEASEQEKTEFAATLLNANIFMEALAVSERESLTNFSHGLLFVEDANRLGVTQPSEEVVELFNEEKSGLADWELLDYSYQNQQPITFEFNYGVTYQDLSGTAVMEDARIILKMQKVEQEWKVVDITN